MTRSNRQCTHRHFEKLGVPRWAAGGAIQVDSQALMMPLLRGNEVKMHAPDDAMFDRVPQSASCH
jgi:hypothetical protein